MKNTSFFLILLLVVAVISGCRNLVELSQEAQDARSITPSDVIITEDRPVERFDALDMSTFGRVTLTQGESEGLTISGSDNIVPLIKTTVSNGKLTIETEENINILEMDDEKVLTFDITVRDLTELTLSGAGDVLMESLITPSLNLVLSGAGNVTINELTAEELDVTVSGVGSLEIAGKVNQAEIEISGVGGVKAGDLECQTATVIISGIGDATVWVTEELNGTISGGGDVSYYGSPQTNTKSTGLGEFKELGEK